jgi:response regulator RpfG family c-di-GMP phosphodiesterase
VTIDAATAAALAQSEAQALLAIRDLRGLRAAAVKERRARRKAEDQLRRGTFEIVRLLVTLLERRLPETAEHGRRVGDLVGRLAQRAGLPEEDVRLIQTAALICDIGLITLPDSVARRMSHNVTPAVARRFQEHAQIGQVMLGPLNDFALLGTWIRHHHERWDGRGYPDQLAGTDIPLAARLIAVCDGYLASVSGDGGGDSARGWRLWHQDRGLYDPDILTLLDQELSTPASRA